MNERIIGAQGVREFFHPARILFATLFVSFASSLLLSTAFAQASQQATQVVPKQEAQIEGQLEIIYQDLEDGKHKLLYSVKQSDGTRVPLQFVGEPPTHLLTGDHVRANGQLSGGSLILYTSPTKTTGGGSGSGSTSGDATGSATSSIPVPNTFGAQSTIVILVNFQDASTQPYTTADAYNAFFGTANSFFVENSYGQTSLTGQVVGWYTIPVSITTCDTSQIATAAQNAATAAGVNLSSFTRYVYTFPHNGACAWAGSSTVGGSPSESWINVNPLDIHVIDHELGHAFGLWHSHSLDCGTASTICSSGNVVEYGDLLDTMGVPQSASADYNAFQKERLGWLNYGASPTIQTVTTGGTYTINPYEVGGSGSNALKVLKGTDPTTGTKIWYYLEARQALGFDAFLTSSSCLTCYTQNETTGVTFHIGTDGNGNSDELLDMTPATPTSSGWFDFSLATGQSFQDSTAGVTITPTSVSSAGATVQITMNGSGGSSCTPAKPSVNVSPSQSQYVTSGTAVSFTATVTDNDSSSCPAATFNLGDGLPSGWTGVWSASTLSLSPGKSGSATLTVTSPVGTADGSYGVNVSATNASAGSYSGSGSATYAISSAPLSVSLTTNQASYLPGQTVTTTVTMLYGTLPDAGASVSVTITPPNGKAATLTGTTGSNGAASLNYKLSNHASAGTYQVQLGTPTTVKAASPVGASTSFTVQ